MPARSRTSTSDSTNPMTFERALARLINESTSPSVRWAQGLQGLSDTEDEEDSDDDRDDSSSADEEDPQPTAITLHREATATDASSVATPVRRRSSTSADSEGVASTITLSPPASPSAETSRTPRDQLLASPAVTIMIMSPETSYHPPAGIGALATFLSTSPPTAHGGPTKLPLSTETARKTPASSVLSLDSRYEPYARTSSSSTVRRQPSSARSAKLDDIQCRRFMDAQD